MFYSVVFIQTLNRAKVFNILLNLIWFVYHYGAIYLDWIEWHASYLWSS